MLTFSVKSMIFAIVLSEPLSSRTQKPAATQAQAGVLAVYTICLLNPRLRFDDAGLRGEILVAKDLALQTEICTA
jgi:hypothetical protein